MGNKCTIDNCISYAKNKEGECLSGTYNNSQTPIAWKCKYGHIWKARFADIKRGTWCPKCVGLQKLDIETCNRVAKSYGGKCLTDVYINIKFKMHWQCKFGHTWYTSLDCIKNQNQWCPKCANVMPLCIDDCIEHADSKSGKCLSTVYINNNIKMMWECVNGHKWCAIFSSIKSGKWCPYCVGKAKKTISDCDKIARSRGGRCLSTTYINSHTKLLWKCKHGHEWKAIYASINGSKSWCPDCSILKTQKELSKLVEELLNSKVYNNYSEFEWLKTKGGRMRIDIWVPKYKLAIEYDGKQHFDPVNFGGMSNEQALENLLYTTNNDKIKNKKIASHPEDVCYFIRFNYKENINTDIVKNKLIKYGVLHGM